MKEHQSKHALAIAIRTALWGGSIFLINGSIFAAPNPSDGQEQNSTQLPTITVSANNTNSLTTEGSGLYTAKATTASTGLALSLKETPQLVSVITRQQMEDQNLTQLTDVVTQAAGLTINQGGNIGSDNSPIYARGQTVDNYLLDGVKLLNSYSSIFQSQDTALFDRIEIVRGANGLMTGAGSASASINMVRKKPLQDFKASVSASAGSWDAYRTDIDVSSPLNQSGNLRGRAVLAYQDGDSYIDRYSEERKVAYGVLEADLTDRTKASLGISYQQIDISGIARGGLPSYYTDGSLIEWSRSDSAAADWTYSDRSTTAFFADIEHKFNDNWKLKGILSRTKTSSDEVVGYAYSSGIDKQTGKGALIYATRWDYEPTQDLFNLTLNGSFNLFNQTHELVLGTTFTKSENQRPTYSGWNNGMSWNGKLDNIFSWNGNTPTRPETMIDGWYSGDDSSYSIFGAVRLKPSDKAAIILGTRVEDWKRVSINHDNAKNTTDIKTHKESGEVIPYVGLTYDLTDHWTTYASYTNIFSPQDKKTVKGDYLDPLVGNSTELGIKGEFFDNQLNIGAAVYQTKEDNFAVAVPEQPDNSHIAPDGSQAYTAESGTKSRGIELEATGKLSELWQISGSFTRNLSQNSQGNSINTNIPNNTAKLFSTYTLPYFDQALTIGGGLRWQSDIYSDITLPVKTRFTQDSYTLVDLMARYKINKNLLLNLNINNLFNEKYHLATTNSYYGAPTNFRVGLKYDW
ncbi:MULTISPECIES: TonB-dependent siderophore receptor [Acinetobacter]|uniref:TonB-dependent siderophore receptor n=1 Tax=Acinetobacter TaxID=469 RepID=UPI001D61ED35|nr:MULTISPECIES: TonB-dependent siderophore receptor [Acinetobacter]MCS4296375.1 outer membrane receptor for ferric coprogen and ferric-rhodotorulic acid [Acinetobacter guillouiae]MCW2250496.1 outer membrane receptor for ferric coprogen and ferric-rhodotorulic acid [Acinetobacter sp. BIGb0204]NII37406.1 outer membrane receptor for ferric coprogen and ferric-rhodotorulic acid [Acinetobacter sp. BIGb0196]